ncbi:MAG: hypothetical protein KDH20_08370 [Rhodocyclaceae bacterium]|nr:hypothetical protein [Rhodocyclaceae bacterium]
MTEQGIFNCVWTHLNAQGKAAVSTTTGDCAYRGEGGTACAAGCLIDDALYDPSIEGTSLLGAIRVRDGDATDRRRQKLYDALVASGVAPKHFEFVHEMQLMHDGRLRDHGLDSWREQMRDFAKDRNLTVPQEPGATP